MKLHICILVPAFTHLFEKISFKRVEKTSGIHTPADSSMPDAGILLFILYLYDST